MNVLGLIMYILNILNLTEDYMRLVSFLVAFYYFARVFGYLYDEICMNEPMNEEILR